MAKTNKPVLVVGGGPAGLFQALYLAKIRTMPVIVIEQQSSVGGMFLSEETPWGLVDRGVHILEATGQADLDQLMFECLPPDSWNVLEGVRKDIAGNYFRGKLNTGSLYPDIRCLPKGDYVRCLGELLLAATRASLELEDSPNLSAYFQSRFGVHATKCVFKPLAEKLWQSPMETLSPWAAKLVHLSRLVAHDHEVGENLKCSPALDSVLGFTDQLRVNPQLLEARRSLYPRTFGLRNVVNGLRSALLGTQVKLMTDTRLNALQMGGDRIRAVTVETAGETSSIEVSAVLWTSPPHPLLPLLGLDAKPPPDSPIPHRTVHLFLDRPPETGALYWLWSYDPDTMFVRISSQSAYCPQVAESGVYPMCIETHIRDASMSDDDVIDQVSNELRGAALISGQTRILGQWVSPFGRSFFVPTLDNCKAISNGLALIDNAGLNNLIVSTQDISSGIFYLRDVLAGSIPSLNSLTAEVIQ